MEAYDAPSIPLIHYIATTNSIIQSWYRAHFGGSLELVQEHVSLAPLGWYIANFGGSFELVQEHFSWLPSWFRSTLWWLPVGTGARFGGSLVLVQERFDGFELVQEFLCL